jgi:hypothetical protein
MRMINALADRLVERFAPTMTADAACIVLSRQCTRLGSCETSAVGYYRCVTRYDNCPSKTEYVCR